jgi:subtilisin-like proprotein convertase family protein
MTDSSSQVARYSSRGNVGIGVEGKYGRFKPDLVAPGSFVVSTRSQQWDTNAYYNPTSHIFGLREYIVVPTNSLWRDSIFVPANTVQFNISVFPNTNSPVPFPDIPIYVRQSALPTNPPPLYDYVGTNSVSLPPDYALNPVGVGWYYALGNNYTQSVSLDLLTDLVVTNEQGNYLEVLSGMNDALGPDYRYESGTSMAAASVSGNLALMQEFFQKMSVTNSPALMKALLINGARSAGPLYNINPRGSINFQGWGLINLPTAIPAALTNITASTNAIFIQDQSPANALATGDSRTFKVTLTGAARNQPLRVTLVWTDPPGNPVASVKLVNDLDLVVTNLANTNLVYIGNDIPAGHGDSNIPYNTNAPPNYDVVNNVENVFLAPEFGENSRLATNYSITVIGRRVNVNAVTAQTNNVVQDYALVISCGDGVLTNGLALGSSAPIVSVTTPLVTVISNSFGASSSNYTGGILLNQHVGANTPLLGTNQIALRSDGKAMMTLGMTNQWHFYVISNINGFTNGAFLTFLPPTLALPRMGVYAATDANSTRPEADIDLFVAPPTIPRNYALTNLDPTVLAAASKSATRGGTETIVLSNAPPGAYYIGVKAEDYVAAEYGLAGVFSALPFSDSDEDGNLHVHGFPIPTAIPDGTPVTPGANVLLGIATAPITLHRAIVTNTIAHEFAGDLLGGLSHNGQAVVLNNHSCFFDTSGGCATVHQYIYDDSDEGNVTGAQHADGPGTLEAFAGGNGVGQWMLVTVDNALNHRGTNLDLSIFLEREKPLTDGIVTTLEPGACRKDYIQVPPEATNLTLTVRVISGTGPFSIQICPLDGGSGCTGINLGGAPATGTIKLDKTSSPPLREGTYVVRICNFGATRATVLIRATLLSDLSYLSAVHYTSIDPIEIRDDGVTNSSLFVGDQRKIAAVEVGIAARHPRISDVAFTLVSPKGTRVLLFENRGGATTNGIGNLTFVTNTFPTTTAGNARASTNVLHVGANSGTLLVDYDFYQIPDSLRVYYDSRRIFDSGSLSNSGRLNIDFGPGQSTDVVIVVNEGTNANPETQWTYTATVVSGSGGYLLFTENTNLTQIPIKYAPTPYGSTNTATNIAIGGFEDVAPGEYAAGTSIGGWTVVSNQVSVIADASLAHSGSHFLALASGGITRTLPTQVGNTYELMYTYRGPKIVSFWRGEGDAVDNVSAANGTVYGPATFAPGLVGQAFSFNGGSGGFNVPDVSVLAITNSITVEGWIYVPQPPSVPGMVLFRGDARGGFDPYYLSVEPSSGGGSLNFIIVNPANISASVSVRVPLNAWTHVAATLDGNSGTMRLYTNGVVGNQIVTGIRPLGPLDPSQAPGVGIGNHSSQPGPYNYPFRGRIDELSVYGRAISASEVSAIYQKASAGKFDAAATIPSALAKVVTLADGAPLNIVYGDNTSWHTNSVAFTPTHNGTTIELDGAEPGALLDTFALSEKPLERAYLPEESLDKLIGENAYGTWKLEMWDSRLGATGGPPKLVAWQLRFRYQDELPQPVSVPQGLAQSNIVAVSNEVFFAVDVPSWAKYATNKLIGASQKADVIFNQLAVPTGKNADDATLLSSTTSGTFVLSAHSSPLLVPSSRYYVGIKNKGIEPAMVSFGVDFDITPLKFGVPYPVPETESLPRYFSFEVSPGMKAASIRLYNLSGDVNLVCRKGFPLPTETDFDYCSFHPANKSEEILLFANSASAPLSPGLWYAGVINGAAASAGYTVLLTSFTDDLPEIVPLANGVPHNAAASARIGATDYYKYTVGTNAVRAQFEVHSDRGGLSLVAHQGLPLPNFLPTDLAATNGPNSDALIVVYDTSSPLPLSPGEWFLAVASDLGVAEPYRITATEFPVYGTNIVMTSLGSASNEICFSWNSLIGVRYAVQGKAALLDPHWSNVSATLTATDVSTSYCIPQSSPYHFFRVAEGQSPVAIPPSIRITVARFTADGVRLAWSGTKAPAQVQWSASLVSPNWHDFTNIITPVDGESTFVDDGTQCGGLGGMRYYRIKQVP